MSSGSWMMPRPSSQHQIRLTIDRVNYGFLGVISQSAKTSRGSWFGASVIVVPSGKTAICGSMQAGGTASAGDDFGFAPLTGFSGATLAAGVLEWSGSQKTQKK